MNTKLYFILLAALFSTTTVRAKNDIINIEKTGEAARPIPVLMSGFTGEVDSVLRFDLYVSGFEFVAADKAQYVISGKNSATLEGRVMDAINKSMVLKPMSYNVGSPRSQAHALANDIIFALTQKKGIAQTQIAFKVTHGSVSEIYVADYDGHNAAAVTQDSSLVSAPAWMPGQQKLFYSSWKAGSPHIYSHDLKARTRQSFSSYPGSNFSPAISPDGQRVAMILSKNGSPDLYVCAINGSNLKQLTQSKEDKSSPCWSPNNQTICYVSREGGRPGLYTISIEGGTARRLQTSGVFSATEPDWSPDGKNIIFTTQRGATNFEICLVPAAGGSATALGVTGEDPSWAPNSRAIIFTNRKNHQRGLSVLDVPTKHVKDIAQISGNSSQPSWAK
ncbi:MAG: hypothetical protein M3Y82_06415 [Verrucomicrobiota bacterium]|nr:hypothetical protein [Verrucomicrobiota bacterium]